MKRIISFLLVAILVLSSVSCSLIQADHGSFDGGEVLDDEMMSEIRSQIYATVQTEIVEVKETEANGSSDEKATEFSALKTEVETLEVTESKKAVISETENIVASELEMLETIPNGDVFWMSSGEVWHLSSDCRYLKNKTLASGSVEDAIAAGKSRACSACGK